MDMYIINMLSGKSKNDYFFDNLWINDENGIIICVFLCESAIECEI